MGGADPDNTPAPDARGRPVNRPAAQRPTPAAAPLPAPLSLLYPNVCPICTQRRPEAETGYCRTCRRALEFVPGTACSRCGGLLNTEHAECRECRDNPRRWQRAASAFVFEGLARSCIHRFKYHGDTVLAPLLARCGWQTWTKRHPDAAVDCLVPVPLHWFRRFTRGYNQAALICEELQQLSGLPILPVIKRQRWTSPQATLNRSHRQRNLRRAFTVIDPDAVAAKEVLLVDDVMTTGATLHECTKQLLKTRVKAVHVLTIARR